MKRAGNWTVAAGGLAATLIGNGIGRFAYTPLIPALIAAGWFSPADAVYLAAANLAGYLAGALGAARLAQAMTGTLAIRLAAVATMASLAACAWPLGFAWYAGWRFLAGVTGGVLMVLAVPAVLALTPPARRGRAAGVVITGVGLGMAIAGAVVPAIAQIGLTFVWLTLAAAVLLLTICVWVTIPPDAPIPAVARTGAGRLSPALRLLLAAYACDALGFIPHTVFWVDYIARGLGRGLETGGAFWIVFGLGAACGPFLAGTVADRAGLGRTFAAGMALKAAGVALPLVWSAPVGLLVSSIIVGALVSGTTTLCSAWVAEQAGMTAHRRVWGWMTSAFAVAQAGGAWGMSYLFATAGSHRPLFLIGAVALAGGAALALASARSQRAAPT
ncbi:putative MFS family arabinose efflux permease [Stella humosa]|uniref:Putative MFS family arabinose efflux permease n=1 Tax=Stella humosa TaxID=94 RepID=A0A3N1LGP0_9PROT|nr:YbfB/YjiJ family MFS transporter [Stella humosa]ROP90582.1 putative MFS family arabinose efflux permease [Stella humosa]BBK29523.1 MFS transporter [Stella humosa]